LRDGRIIRKGKHLDSSITKIARVSLHTKPQGLDTRRGAKTNACT
jgi:hypothetical protein